MSILFLLLMGTGWACPVDTATFREGVDAALADQEARAWDAFETSMARVRRELGCVTEVLDASSVSRVHDLESRVALRQKDFDAATLAFQGVLGAEPGFQFDARYPAGHPWRQSFDAARVAADPMEPLRAGQWVVDGRLNQSAAPVARNSLVQGIADDGAVLSTWYLRGDGLPAQLKPLAVAPEPTVAVSPPIVGAPTPTVSPPNRAYRGAAWMGAASVVMFGSGVAIGVASKGQAATLTEAQWGTRRALNYVGVFGGVTLGVGATGLAVAGWRGDARGSR